MIIRSFYYIDKKLFSNILSQKFNIIENDLDKILKHRNKFGYLTNTINYFLIDYLNKYFNKKEISYYDINFDLDDIMMNKRKPILYEDCSHIYLELNKSNRDDISDTLNKFISDLNSDFDFEENKECEVKYNSKIDMTTVNQLEDIININTDDIINITNKESMDIINILNDDSKLVILEYEKGSDKMRNIFHLIPCENLIHKQSTKISFGNNSPTLDDLEDYKAPSYDEFSDSIKTMNNVFSQELSNVEVSLAIKDRQCNLINKKGKRSLVIIIDKKGNGFIEVNNKLVEQLIEDIRSIESVLEESPKVKSIGGVVLKIILPIKSKDRSELISELRNLRLKLSEVYISKKTLLLYERRK